MANTKSAQKKVRQSERRYKINLARRTTVKTAIKKVLTAISSGEKVEVIKDLMRNAESEIGRAKNKVFHGNATARKIGRLAKKVAEYEKNLAVVK